MKPSELLILGFGTAGSRAAYYIYQRGCASGVRILAADSDQEALATLPGVETILMPNPADAMLENSQIASEDAQRFFMALHRYLSSTRLLILVTCLGRSTGNYYSVELSKFAHENNVKVAVIAAMPHSFDDPAWHEAAKATLLRLHEVADTVLPLPCSEFARLFPDQEQNEAYPQAAQWIAETALGFVNIFCRDAVAVGSTSLKSTRSLALEDDAGQLYFDFKEMPRGIFSMLRPSSYYNENRDIPTFLRQHLQIDDGRD